MRRILFITVTALVLAASEPVTLAQTPSGSTTQRLGFDRNLYPGDDTLPSLRKHFSFTGYWLNNPPGETANTWRGKRDVLLRNNFGFLVLFNGRLDAEILKSRRRGTAPEALGKQDAAAAISAAQREHFPSGTVLFLDQEE